MKRRTLRMLSNGLYVITSRAGARHGAATVTWVSQASFRPPLLMAALRPESNVFQCLRESGLAAVHILGRDQQDLAQKFFAPTRAGEGLLNGEPFVEGTTSAPVLRNAPAYLECRVRHIIDAAGDHAIVIMEVTDAACRDAVRTLTIAESPWEYGG
ncbi:MAG: flavin reductase family protein [Candidatus Rokubacteria bacterium]|nr:flavin reductase family protein [Candidatus Rokubacteria bacterium]